MWCQRLPDTARVEQDDWDKPLRADWVIRLDETIAHCAQPLVLVAPDDRAVVARLADLPGVSLMAHRDAAETAAARNLTRPASSPLSLKFSLMSYL